MTHTLETIDEAGPTSGLVKPLMSDKTKVAILFVALVALCTEVEAGYSVASMTVSAIVRNACTASTLAQGQDMKAVASVSATGEVSVDCAINTPYNIALNEGVISGASVASGTTTAADNTLAFNVFKDSAHTNPWGTKAGPGALSGTYRTLQNPHDVFGALAPDQTAAPNSERMTMTVNY